MHSTPITFYDNWIVHQFVQSPYESVACWLALFGFHQWRKDRLRGKKVIVVSNVLLSNFLARDIDIWGRSQCNKTVRLKIWRTGKWSNCYIEWFYLEFSKSIKVHDNEKKYFLFVNWGIPLLFIVYENSVSSMGSYVKIYPSRIRGCHEFCIILP